MDIKDLESAIPSNMFEYIIFDACLMGSVEVAYQLRNKTKYILASPTETLADGLPYEDIIATLFDNDAHDNNIERLQTVGTQYMNYYNTNNGSYKSASISLINTKHLKTLAESVYTLLNSYTLSKWEYKDQEVQKLDIYEKTLTFDFLDFLNKNYPDILIQNVETCLDNVVMHKAHTTRFLDLYDIIYFCGLSCYIPQKDEVFLNKYYQTLDWSSDSGFDLLFSQ